MSEPLIRHKSAEERLRQGHVWDEEAGQKVIRFAERYLVLEDGRPLVLMPWMKDCIRSWYCWKRPNGTRSVKIGLLSCGRKNAKSVLTYALTAYHLIAEPGVGKSCVSCACDKAQAAQIYGWLTFAIDRHPVLKNALHYVNSKKEIVYPKMSSVYKSLSSETRGGKLGHGHNFVVVDELAFHKSETVYNQLKDSGKARPNSLQIITSTSGWNRNSDFYRLVQHSRKVLSGEVVDLSFEPWIFEAKTDDYDDEANWRAANPSMGVTIDLDEFREQWDRDKQNPTSKLTALRLNMNVWTESESGWISLDDFDKCKGGFPVFDKTTPVYLGLDYGMTQDLTAISMVAKVSDRYYLRTWGYVPEKALTRENQNTHIYQTCQQAGCLELTKGKVIDERYICKKLDELVAMYDVRAVAFDKWNALTTFNHLTNRGVQAQHFPQYHSWYNGPAVEFERLIHQGKFVHDGNPLLRWQLGHTSLHRDSKGYVKPVTQQPYQKKDNIMATLMAMSQCLTSAEARPSVYETRGLTLV